MTPNPTARPFIVGALLFLSLVSFWPRRVSADRAHLADRPAVARSLYR